MPQEIKSIPITFANTGIVIKSAPDELPITAYKALMNVITDRENSISVRKGFTRLNDGLPSSPHSLYYLKDVNGIQWRYAICSVVATDSRGRTTRYGKLYCAPVIEPNDSLIWPLASKNYFLPVDGGDKLSPENDPRALFSTYTLIGSEIKPYVFFTDGTKFLKHAGGNNSARRIGIPKPTSSPTLVARDQNTTEDIEDFDDKDQWTPTNCILTNTTKCDGASTGYAMEMAVTPGDEIVGSAYKSITSGGYPIIANLGIDGTSTIEIWMKFVDAESALNCQQITIDFCLSHILGDATFQTSMQKTWVPSAFQGSTAGGSTGRTTDYTAEQEFAYDIIFGKVVYGRNQGYGLLNDLRNFGIDLGYPDDLQSLDPIYLRQLLADRYGLGWDASNPTFGDPRDSTGDTVVLPPSSGVWIRQRVTEDEFKRIGTDVLTRPDLSWAYVTAIRIDIKTIASATGGKTCNVEFDFCQRLTTGNLEGWDYQWVYTFYNSKTNTESDYSPVAAVPAPGAQHDSYTLTLPRLPVTTPPESIPDKVRVYRMGGTVSQFQLLDIDIPYVAGSIPVVVDDQPDSLLGQVLEIDNQLPMAAVTGIELYDDRLWTWGGYYTTDDGETVPEPPNRIRFSKAVRVEHFPTANYLYVGTGSEQIQRIVENDGQLFVFTLTRVYNIIGSSGVYRAIATPVNQGLKSRFGIVRGLRSLYMHAYDGIYEFPAGRKISEPINQVFFDQRLNEIDPVAVGREAECCMGFWDSKVYFSYPNTLNAAIKNNRTLIWDTLYERWHYYLYGAYFYYTEPQNNILLGGTLTIS